VRGNGRVLITLIVAVLLVGGGVAAAYLFYPWLPHPADADRNDLLRWLVLRDLNAESPEIQTVLAQRLEEEFSTGLDWDATAERLTAPQRERVWDNVTVLLKPWFLEKSDSYFQLAVAERPAFMHQLTETIAVWRGVDSLRLQPIATADDQQRKGLFGTLSQQVTQWKKEAEPDERARIEEFFATVQMFSVRLPDPADADCDELVQWLVVRDLRNESPETLSVLMRRLEEEFRTGFDWSTRADDLDESQRKQIWDNVVLLMKPWFFDKTERYFQLADDQRPAYVDELIDMITAWKDIDSLRTPEDPAASRSEQGGLLATLAEKMEEWKQGVNPAERERIEEFSKAIQVRIFRRMLSKFTRG